MIFPTLVLFVSLLAGAVAAISWELFGGRLLRQIPGQMFRKLLDLLILALGVFMLVHGLKLRK